MDDHFRDIPLDVQLLFLDDLLTHGPDEMSTLANFRATVRRMAEIDLQICSAKTKMLVKEVKFCGHKIRDGNMMVCEERARAISELVPPRSKKGAQSVFGLFNYLRAFIKDFASIAKPITETFKGYHFQWTAAAQRAMDVLKALVVSNALKLAIPDVNRDALVLETDASDTTMAACLYVCSAQHVGDHGPQCLAPVEFYSENFTESQFKKYILEKELLALRGALAKFRMYLLGRRFVWRTDSNSLRWAKSLRTTRDKIARLLAEVGEFDFEVQVRRSADMAVTDCLSRPAFVNALRVRKSEIKGMQEKDPILSRVRNFVRIDRWPNFPTDKRVSFYKNRRGDLRIDEDGYLVCNSGVGGDKLIIPDFMKSEILVAYHDESGHPGSDNTIATISTSYFWHDLSGYVREYVRSCAECQRDKPNLHPRTPPMAHTDTPSGPFQRLRCDLTGPLPMTNRNKVYILVVNDHFSKKVSAKALATKHASEVLRHFREIVCANPRMPRTVLTDHGTEFMGEFDMFLSSSKIRHVRSAPYHPQSNGLTERCNQSLKARLKPKKNPHDWDLRLPEVVQQLNLAPNEQTRFSPFEVENGMVGSNPKNPIDFDRTITRDVVDIRNRVFERQNAEKAKRVARNDRPGFVPFSVGDKVWARARVGLDRYDGPYSITELLGRGESYVIRDEDGKSKKRRAEELKPVVDRSGNFKSRSEQESDNSVASELPVLRLAPQWLSINSPFFGSVRSRSTDGGSGRGSSGVPENNHPSGDNSSESQNGLFSVPRDKTDQVDIDESAAGKQDSAHDDLLDYSEYADTVGTGNSDGDAVSQGNNDSDDSIDTVIDTTGNDENGLLCDPLVRAVQISLNERIGDQDINRPNIQSSPSSVSTSEFATPPSPMRVSGNSDSSVETNLDELSVDDVQSTQPDMIKLRSGRLLEPLPEVAYQSGASDMSVDDFEMPNDVMSKEALRNHLQTVPYTRSEPLFHFEGYRALKDVKRIYRIPNEIKTKQEISDHIFELYPDIAFVYIRGIRWPIVTVEYEFGRESSTPLKSKMKDGTAGYCLQQQSYHQLLVAAILMDLCVEKMHLGNRRMILDKMCKSIMNKDGEISYRVEEGNFWVLDKIG